MKRLMTAAVALIFAAGMVSAAEVTSANVVGYSNRAAIGDGWTLLGSNWEKVGGGSLTFAELIGNESELTDGDVVQIYVDPSTAITYTYFAPDWYDGDFNIASPVLAAGSAVWFYHAGAAMTFTLVGQVIQDDVVSTLPANVWTQFASGIPAGFNPADVGVEWSSLTDGSVIQKYISPESSVTYTYFGPDWYDGDFNVVQAPIADAGEGLWFFNASPDTDATLTQHPPAGI